MSAGSDTMGTDGRSTCCSVQPLCKWPFLIDTHKFFPVIMPIGIYPTNLKTYVCTKTCTWMFIVSLFIFARKWKASMSLLGEQTSCSPSVQWDTPLITKNALSSHAKTWRNGKYTLLSYRILHAVGFQQYDILETAKLQRW